MSYNDSLNENQFDEDFIEKPKKFKKFFSLFKFNKKIEEAEEIETYTNDYSKFKEYLFLVDENENNEGVLEAINICDDNLKLARHKAHLDKRRNNYKSTLEDLECYNNLSEEDAKTLKNLISKYVHLNNERKTIRYQFADFNSSINKLQPLEEDAYDAIVQIEDAEKQKRLLKRDIEIIKAEKEKTISDKEKLIFSYNFIYKFSIALLFILGFAIVFLTLVYMTTKENIFLTLSILCFTLILTITLIYIFRRKIVFELKLNEKKQKKLITLLNKKTVVYSYYINYLNYVYKKYNAKNSRNLKENLKDVESYKNMTNRYDNIGKIFYEVQDQLETFLFKNEININKISLESFAKSINVDNKISYYKNIEDKIKILDEKIKKIEEQQNELTEKLVELNVADITSEKVIEKIMKAYIVESEKIILDDEDDEQDNTNFEYDIENEKYIDKFNEDE